jgi:hypothetical protein
VEELGESVTPPNACPFPVTEPRVLTSGGPLIAFLLLFAFAARPAPIDPLAAKVTRQLDIIESGKAKPGSVFHFTSAELNAWVRATAPTIVPEGFRQPRLELGDGSASADALVDFLKLRHASGVETGWLVTKLIEGEKRVRVTASIQSANGRATVHLARVEIGGLAVTGAALDFLIRTFFLPLYPNAKIDEPFELEDHIDRIEVTPAEARVYITK